MVGPGALDLYLSARPVLCTNDSTGGTPMTWVPTHDCKRPTIVRRIGVRLYIGWYRARSPGAGSAGPAPGLRLLIYSWAVTALTSV